MLMMKTKKKRKRKTTKIPMMEMKRMKLRQKITKKTEMQTAASRKVVVTKSPTQVLLQNKTPLTMNKNKRCVNL